MPNDLENMYQYDSERKQYRRKSESSPRSPVTPKATGGGDIYSIGSKHEKNEYREGHFEHPKDITLGRRILWLTMLAILAGWLYYVMVGHHRSPIKGGAPDSVAPPTILRLE